MKLNQLGRSGLYVSELALGAMTFGRELDESDARAIVDRFIDAGGNFIDTANVYNGGESEAILGRILDQRRHDVVVATKVRGPMGPGPYESGLSRKHIMDSVDASLKRLQTDYIDLYQCHSWDPTTPIEETMRALSDLVDSGKVRYIGCSNFAGWQLATAIGLSRQYGWAPIVSLQPQYSLLSREVERELIPLAEFAGLAILPWSPLGGGVLSGKYTLDNPALAGTRGETAVDGRFARSWNSRFSEASFEIVGALREVAAGAGKTMTQTALRWLLQKPGVTSPIIGARALAQLDENLGATGWSLSEEQAERLDEASSFALGYPYES